MKTRITALCVGLLLSQSALADWRQQCDLDCLYCPELDDPEQYTEGALKTMNQITFGRDNWLFRSDADFSNEFGVPEAFVDDYHRLMYEFRQLGITVVFALQPTRGLMHRDKIIPELSRGFDFAASRASMANFQEQLRDGGAVVPDMLPLVDNPPEVEYFFRRDHHWTPTGARATAVRVADAVKSLLVYDNLPEKTYSTEEYLVIPKFGTMNYALRAICGNSYSDQYVPGFQTIPDATGEDALFGDTADPEVVLIGTSNSAVRDVEQKNFNFEGFLKEYLETDILNYALPGAGQDGALIQYLQSDDFLSGTLPKIVIWELPINYRLDDELMYRQLIPGLRGGCQNASSVVLQNSETFARLTPGEREEILANTGDDQLELSNYSGFLELNFSDQNFRDFYVITYYDNGNRDKVWFRRYDVVDGGRYLLELSDSPEFKDANLLSVFIEPTKPVEQEISVDVQLCPM